MIGDCVISVWSFIHSFIHSAYFYSASSSPLLLRGDPDTARILCRSFTSKRHRKLQVKVAQGPYMARAGFELMNLRTKGDRSTKKPPRPPYLIISFDCFVNV